MHSDCLCCFSRQILPHAEIDAGAGGRLQNLLDLDIRGLHEHSPFCFINTKTFSISPKSCSSVSVSTMQQTNINKTFLACFSCFSFRFFFLGSCEVMILQKHGQNPLEGIICDVQCVSSIGQDRGFWPCEVGWKRNCCG